MDLLNRMEIPAGIAKNKALLENVFVTLVCMLNLIPVFVVGKNLAPGKPWPCSSFTGNGTQHYPFISLDSAV